MVLFALAAVLLAGLLRTDAAVYSSLTLLVRHAQRKEAIQLKEEYHAFRDRAGVVLFAFTAALLAGLLRADALLSTSPTPQALNPFCETLKSPVRRAAQGGDPAEGGVPCVPEPRGRGAVCVRGGAAGRAAARGRSSI